jgi:hypothetical protein
MMRPWIARHRSLVATATSGAVVLAVVATVALTSTGYTAQRMDLGDGAVWVANGVDQAVGRANPEVLELNSVVRGRGADLEIVQRGTTVLLVDHSNATVQFVDPATSTPGEAIALPPEEPSVYLAGDRVVIHARGTGELWIVGLAELPSFDASSEPTLSLGLDSVVSVAPDGLLFAYAADVGEVYRVPAARSDVVDASWEVERDDEGRPVQVTSVDGVWAVFDPDTRRVTLESGVVDLASAIPAGEDAVLQEPSEAGDRVLIASEGGLLAISSSGQPVILADGRAGTPAAPLVVAGCAYAGWGDGSAWRHCPGDGEGVDLALAGMPGGTRLDFAANIDRVVLNDRRGGASWAVQERGEVIDNWEALLVEEDDQETEEPSEEIPPEQDEAQKPPVAVDDTFGARPGRASVLPVLLNDYDPNADVLVIESVDPIPEELGRVDLVTRDQQVQLTLAPEATGTATFGYTISDGRGGTARALVTVTVRGDQENGPPQQVRATRATVAEGGRVQTQVIGDWVDPDGDAFYLTAASTAEPDQVSHKPDGAVVFADAGGGGDLKSVTLTMSDGRAEASGGVAITVRPRDQVPIVIESWFVPATAGQEVTVRPLEHVRGGSGEVRLNAVPARAGSTTRASFEAGTFTFTSDEVRTHYVEFTVTDGDATATGVVRIDVSSPPDANTRPVTVPKTIFVTTLSNETIDPTTTDIDPAGGVLVVTGVADVPASSGLRAEVLDQRQVRVTLTAPLEDPVTFHYRISNGLADAEGSITVVEIPPPARFQPPIAADDAVTVRVGDVIDIPVLANDEQPEGEPIALVPELAQPLPDGAGLLFASGDQLRYLAPEIAGNYTAVYSVEGSDGQRAEARLTISVREVNEATNNPPVPQRVTARVLAGEKVQVQIPLAGIDPDGDSVQLVGVASNPEKGTVVTTGPGVIEFEAGEYSSGTDSFRYVVVDGLGARAEGIVRVGISPRLDGARNPVANEDLVAVRPGRTVSVQVLANDSDPDGSPLRVVSAVPNTEDTEAEVVDDAVVRITPPAEPGTYAVIYTIANEFGGTSSTFVTVQVDPEAPLAYPVARDVVLEASDVVDRDVLDVAVLDSVFSPDGDVADLGVSLLPGFGGSAALLPDKRIRVEIGDESQIIPFAVSHSEDASVRSLAFIWVPGYEDTLPQLDRTAPPLVVASEDTLRIDLDDYVIALGGSGVRLTDSSTVRATHADGEDLVEDEDTLVFTSADQYFGPASITFEVTDGSTANDPDGRRAILTLPITVEPRENQPPVFIGGVVEFEPGQQKELDLVRLTNYPYDDIAELAYTILEPLPDGVTAELNGQRLILRATDGAVKGTSASVRLGVRDGVSEGQAGQIEMRIVASTRPLAQPVADVAITPRGGTTVVDVLANDQANNPFPTTPLRVVAIRGIDGASLPAGIAIEPSADRSRLTVTVTDDALPADTSLQYQVGDATGDSDRQVWGAVTISVQDVPEPVTGFEVEEFGDRTLVLSWVPGQFNNSPIVAYRVTMTTASGAEVLGVTTCTTSVGCAVTTPGNGPGNAVRLAVVAVNGIGDSGMTVLPGSIWSDIIPPPPTAVGWTALDHGLRVTWRKPPNPGGSAIERYVVTVGGAVQVVDVAPGDPVGTPYAINVQNAGLANGSAVSFSVSARNRAPNSLATWNQAGGTGIPAGAPIATGAPVSASGSMTDGATATAAWPGAFAANGAVVTTYWAVIRSDGSTPTCGVAGVESGAPVLTPPSGPGVVQVDGATSTVFTGLAADVTYEITVFAYNGQGCTAAAPVDVTPRAAPPTVTQASVSAGPVPNGEGFWDFTVGGVGTGRGVSSQYDYVYRLAGGTTEGTESAVRSGTSFLTAGTSHYGNDISVQFKACVTYPEGTICSATWSAPFPLGVPVWNSEPGELTGTPDDEDGIWNWLSAPASPTPGAWAVEYSCDDGDTWTAMPQVGSCLAEDGIFGLGTPRDLVVRISAEGARYERSYDWDDYAN